MKIRQGVVKVPETAVQLQGPRGHAGLGCFLPCMPSPPHGWPWLGLGLYCCVVLAVDIIFIWGSLSI